MIQPTPLPAQPYERLGSFYLGRQVDAATGREQADLLLYDSRDLTTHAVCVGMTGSGKTGLCLSLLEEAAIDGIPAIAIDPKGDLGNLLLSFPELRAEDFAPWIDPGEAARKGMTPAAFAERTAHDWRRGLAEWDQDGERIRRLHDAAELAIYTPGNEAGHPLSILRSFCAPPAELRADAGALRERIASSVSSLLSLAGIDADPLRSREHILLSTLFDRAWNAGRDLDLPALIQTIHKPPFDTVGVFDLETFYPAKDRLQLAMSINNLIAAPGFAAWMQGDALDIQRLLFTPAGKPRIAIISIAHLNDAERMFVVTLLLGEIVAWMRRQSGTSSLRALLYMDEIFGYFPPTAMPPSKPPLLTLMKQARAFGLGVVLATQNPVDLDYKGLSNAGTWFIGRLQTERDKARLIDGLLGAAGEGSGGTLEGRLDKPRIEGLLAGLGNRVFLMHNVHDVAPVLFRTRWAMSYLRGPMTVQEIARITAAQRSAASVRIEAGSRRDAAHTPALESTAAATIAGTAQKSRETSKPVIPAGIEEYYLHGAVSTSAPAPEAGAISVPAAHAAPPLAGTYQPRILGVARMHFVDTAAGVDAWEIRSWVAPLGADGQSDWTQADHGTDLRDQLSPEPPEDRGHASAPAALLRPQNYVRWRKTLASHIHANSTMTLFRCPQAGASMAAGDDEGEFRARLSHLLHEKRDTKVDRLRKKYAARLTALEDQVRRANQRIERERSQLSQQKMQTVISVGTSLVGMLLGRRKLGTTNAGRIGTAARNAGRIGKESDDVNRAEESREILERRLTELRTELEQEIDKIKTELDPRHAQVQRIDIKPRKADIEILNLALVWV
ncbi:hypothetical protein ACG33_14930 [Steroidobacter denitrificans]|uniref:ATP-binding protein n=1 Tax=Steroidobacter denitrificans TaxID=465721 RepID=A0A127FDB6_STEDE|nr:hypothetical protein [Steroidobacter denitrificans]AMN48367.1 hypothetical protein ACG33_14930 [Steroidobacter denitrificans]